MSIFGPDYQKAEEFKNPLTEEELAVFDRLARLIDRYGLTIPAIMFFETMKPANFIISQGMVVAEPLVAPVLELLFRFKDYDKVRTALEKRQAPEILIRKIEELNAISVVKEKAFKKWYRQEKKKWRWYQRYLGIARPKLRPPEHVLNPPALEEITNDSSQSHKDAG
jgi:hypothetical protein